ncbi:hypothetical protein [Streptomyces umbrinus]|uniref:hypothetical protein n=1 Tax=Streptomyces umbrinus TaxID=67370 RepID=UPI00341DEF15
MARRIRAASVEQVITEKGHPLSEYWDGDWDPGFRVAQGGTRTVFVFYEGPGEADQLDAITSELREAGYQVHHSQMRGGGRRRLEVTRP